MKFVNLENPIEEYKRRNKIMKLASVTKHITFDAAHYLVNPDLSKEDNIKVFHKCCLYKEDGLEEPHGHTYHLEVCVMGIVDEVTGYVIDFKVLKKILQEGIVEKLDHRLINNIEYFKTNRATVENILHFVWDEIVDKINNIRPKEAWIHSIKIWETPDSFAVLDNNMANFEKGGCQECGGCQEHKEQ